MRLRAMARASWMLRFATIMIARSFSFLLEFGRRLIGALRGLALGTARVPPPPPSPLPAYEG